MMGGDGNTAFKLKSQPFSLDPIYLDPHTFHLRALGLQGDIHNKKGERRRRK
jgi:hypothetical protein